MANIKARESETLWYILLTVAASVVAALMVDEKFVAEIGTIGLLGLYLADKIIHVGLRLTTTKEIETPKILKPKETRPLNPLEQALKDDNDELMGKF